MRNDTLIKLLQTFPPEATAELYDTAEARGKDIEGLYISAHTFRRDYKDVYWIMLGPDVKPPLERKEWAPFPPGSPQRKEAVLKDALKELRARVRMVRQEGVQGLSVLAGPMGGALQKLFKFEEEWGPFDE